MPHVPKMDSSCGSVFHTTAFPPPRGIRQIRASPAAPALRCLRLATLAWVRISDRPTAAPVGLALAHTLLTYLPHRTELLRLVLPRLPEHLLPTTDMWDAPTPRTQH